MTHCGIGRGLVIPWRHTSLRSNLKTYDTFSRINREQNSTIKNKHKGPSPRDRLGA